MSFAIQQTDDLKTCFALRRVVFIEEQGVPEMEEVDDLDATALHLLATEDAMPVGTARVCFKGGEAKIGRVCVLRSHRGRGLGAALINKALNEATDKAATARLGAQLHALTFYERLGFVQEGPVYDDAGIAHRDMVRDL